MKPIPTLYKPLMSVDIETHEILQGNCWKKWSGPFFQQQVYYGSCCGNGSGARNPWKFSSDNLEELAQAVAKHRDYTKNY